MTEPKRKASEAYLAKLRDPRWQKMRLEVFQRDNFQCQFCEAADQTLHVHHLQYIRGKEPWEYELPYLLTLCEGCHEMEHDRPEMEQKLLETLRLAKLPAMHIDCLAAPTPFGCANFVDLYHKFFQILNADMYQTEHLLEVVDSIRSAILDHKSQRTKAK